VNREQREERKAASICFTRPRPLYGVERSRRLFFPVALASRFFLNGTDFTKRCSANGDSTFAKRVEHAQLLDNWSGREALAQSAFAFSDVLPIESHALFLAGRFVPYRDSCSATRLLEASLLLSKMTRT